MADKINVAVIGCNTIANSAHIPAYMANGNCKIKYFCDIAEKRADAAAEKYGCGKTARDYHDLLNDPELTAVSICTPNHTHSQISVDFLKAGKHVLCEKPAACTLEDVLLMQKTQHETGLVLSIGVVNRYNNAVMKIKDLIDCGVLGKIYHVYLSFRSHRSIPGLGGVYTRKAVSGGGVLIDWGVHFIDLVMYCCGDPELLTVSGKTFSKLGSPIKDYAYESMWAGPPDYNGVYDVEDSVTALVRTRGPVLTLHGAWAQNIGQDEMYIDFCGTEGGIRLQYGKDFTLYGTRDGKLFSEKSAFESTDMFQNEINAFINCIQTGKRIPSHIDNIVPTAKMIEAIYHSSETGHEIQL